MAKVTYHASRNFNAPPSISFYVDDRTYVLDDSFPIEMQDKDVKELQDKNYIFQEGIKADMILISDYTEPVEEVEEEVSVIEPKESLPPTTARRRPSSPIANNDSV